jgi:predicted outer membrane repeat protein
VHLHIPEVTIRMTGLMLILALPVIPPSAEATTNVVTSLGDSGPGTLRDAIATVGLDGSILFATNGSIRLVDEIPAHDVNILGPGAGVLGVRGGTNRVFRVSGRVFISGLTISGGHAPDGLIAQVVGGGATAGGPGEPGGGIYNEGTLILSDCVLTQNSAGTGGQGWSPHGLLGSPTSGGEGGNGGGVYNLGTLSLSNCVVSYNAAGTGGASGYSTWGPGGGDGGWGGGIYNAGTLWLEDSTVTGNSAGTAGANGPHGGTSYAGLGGGIWSGQSVSANRCAFSYNSSGGGGGALCGGSLSLTNCTVTGNGPGWQGGAGGGIQSTDLLNLVNCTVAGNQGGSIWREPGGVYHPAGGGQAQVLNTIIAGNTGSVQDVAGEFTSLGHNLIGVTNSSTGFGVPGDLVGGSASPLDPGLGPLADNGGPTLTIALRQGSPAINAGDNAAVTPTDQRGYARRIGPAVDIGAYEYGYPSLIEARPQEAAILLLVYGSSGQTCCVMTSSNLQNWIPLATNQIPSNGIAVFRDDTAGAAERFYRVWLP